MWHLDGTRAVLEQRDVRGEIDLAQAERGLAHLTLPGGTTGSDTRLLAMEPVEGSLGVPADCYVRGTDLIVTYSPQGTIPLSTQLYWRVLPAEADALLALELIISRQTQRLDSDPRLTVTTVLPADAVWHLTTQAEPPRVAPLRRLELAQPQRIAAPLPGVLLMRSKSPVAEYAVMAHPSDFRTAHITTSADGETRVSFDLFRERLEKGVIRRGRLHARVWPDQRGSERLAQSYLAITAEPPPLTT